MGIFQEYERQGGPNGWLGFPITDSGFAPVSPYTYNDFEKGILVWYETIPAVAPAIPMYRVAAPSATSSSTSSASPPSATTASCAAPRTSTTTSP